MRSIYEAVGMLVVETISYETSNDVILNALLEECAAVFSRHYGKWRSSGKNVKLSSVRLRRDYFFDNTCRLHVARFKGKCIGYAMSKHFNIEVDGRHEACHWITQLVVHSEFRGYGIGKRLCGEAFNFRSSFAYGIVTSNPYAVKCLEDVTGKYCDPLMTRQYYDTLVRSSNIRYLQDRPLCGSCQVDTGFDVDHTGNLHKLEEILRKENQRWMLDHILNCGHEFVACTFRHSTLDKPSRCGVLLIDADARHSLGIYEEDAAESLSSALQNDKTFLAKFSDFVDKWADNSDIVFHNTFLRYTRLHETVKSCVLEMLSFNEGGCPPYMRAIEIIDEGPTPFHATIVWE